ncbi:MAG: response regulator transcription factor [Anaerolineae bacterium]|nr:response regulator transcription factor [Anaerolineae bacterium]
MTVVLVVDDEESIRNVVAAYLKAEGYIVLTAEDGLKGLEMFRQHQPELVILDIMLPGMDGLKVLQLLREESDTYVLLLTARSEETDRVTGLMMGSDDYLTKPFSPLELLARVKAILRRGRSTIIPQEGVIQWGGVRIDTKRHKVWRGEEEIDLTALEFQILKTLAEHVGMVLSREQLLQQVWGYDFFGDDRVVDVHIRHIRQKLEADPNNPQMIVTVRGVGYRFEQESA